MQVTVTAYRCSKLKSARASTLTTQLLHVKILLEIKYLVCRAKKLLQFSYEIYETDKEKS